MKSIDEIQHQLLELARELGKMKEAQPSGGAQTPSGAQFLGGAQFPGGAQPSGEIKIDFEGLSEDAYHMPIAAHPLEQHDIYTKKCYITLLLYLSKFDPDKMSYSILLVHRLAFGMKYLDRGYDLQAEYTAAQTLTFKQFDEIKRLLKDDDGRFMLILDCLLIVGGFDKGKKNAIGYVLQLSQLLGINREQIIFLSELAAAVLTQKIDVFAEAFVRDLLFQSFSSIRKFIAIKDKHSAPREYQLWKELESAFDVFKSQNSAAAAATLSKSAFKLIKDQGVDFSEKVSRDFVLSDNVAFYHLLYRALISHGFSPWDIGWGEMNFLNDAVVQNLKQYLAISKDCPAIFSEVDMHEIFEQAIDEYNVEKNAREITSEKKGSSQKMAWTLTLFVGSHETLNERDAAKIFDGTAASGKNLFRPGQPIPKSIPLLLSYIRTDKANNPVGKWSIFACYLDDLTAPHLKKKGR